MQSGYAQGGLSILMKKKHTEKVGNRPKTPGASLPVEVPN